MVYLSKVSLWLFFCIYKLWIRRDFAVVLSSNDLETNEHDFFYLVALFERAVDVYHLQRKSRRAFLLFSFHVWLWLFSLIVIFSIPSICILCITCMYMALYGVHRWNCLLVKTPQCDKRFKLSYLQLLWFHKSTYKGWFLNTAHLLSVYKSGIQFLLSCH